jgi:two-component system cell cycle sensor histidine kinase/response regulator CckA
MMHGGPETPLSVLVVEHDSADAELSIAELRRAGFTVNADVVPTRPEMETALAAGSYDVVLADYRLPGWTGMDALAVLREGGFDIPLILVTGTLGEERAVECLTQGVSDYIIKSNLVRLPIAVRRVLSERRTAKHMRDVERAWREREERFRDLAENISEVFFVQKADFSEALYINPAYEKLWGQSCDSLYANPMSFLDPVPEEDRLKVMRAVEFLLSGGESVENEFRVVRADGSTRWVLSRMVAVRDAQGVAQRICGVTLDVTERHLAQAALESSAAQLRQAQKMEAIGRLAGAIAHDFNNLLTVIGSNADFLLEGLAESDPNRELAMDIGSASTAAAGLTRQLLAFSHQQVIQPRIIDADAVVHQAERMLRRVIGEDVTVTRTSIGAPLPVLMDPGQLEQVVMNLAVNARDAMPRGGTLSIVTAPDQIGTDRNAANPRWRPGRYVKVSVGDTGTGMDQATRARIFEPFFTTREPGKGTGLGLATVYAIVTDANGYVEVESEVGKGSTFTAWLPRAAAMPEETSLKPAEPLARGTEMILLIEDDAKVRETVRAMLERLGYIVLEAPDARIAQGFAASRHGRIKLLITDVVMPGMSGREIAESLMSRDSGLRVLYMSGYTDDLVLRHGVKTASTHFLQKPFTSAALAAKVRQVLDA